MECVDIDCHIACEALGPVHKTEMNFAATAKICDPLEAAKDVVEGVGVCCTSEANHAVLLTQDGDAVVAVPEHEAVEWGGAVGCGCVYSGTENGR